MKLHIDLNPSDPGFGLTHSDALFLIGSCFSENIGELLIIHRFKTYINPHGIVFNPLSMAQSLDEIAEGKTTNPDFILKQGERYYSFAAHSSLSGSNRDELIEKLNAENHHALAALKTAKVLILTLGSAYYYYHKSLGFTVSNCHRLAQQTFDKKLCSVEAAVTELDRALQKIETLNPGLKIILTVSPVKHLRDGVVENTLSKATLLLTCHNLAKGHSNRCYFPAYELVTDDLRDYRFYKEDLAHPNSQAIAYVWEKFSQTFFSGHTRQINQLTDAIHKAKNHRSTYASGQEHNNLQQHIRKLEDELKNLAPNLI